jgi:hypothetical protein
LQRYQRQRRFDGLMLAAVTKGLNRLFSNRIAPVRPARGLGLAAVDRLLPLKRLMCATLGRSAASGTWPAAGGGAAAAPADFVGRFRGNRHCGTYTA